MLLGMRQGPIGDPNPSAVINWDFLQSQSLTSFSRTSNATLFDSTGKLTYAANNLLVSTATLSTQTVTTGLQAGMNVILSFYGTGSVSISGGYTGSLAGTGVSDRVYLKFTTTTASLTFTVSGSVTNAQLEAVTYQTTPSAYVYNTTTPTSQYYGPRYPYAYNGTTWDAQGLLVEAAAVNSAPRSDAFNNSSWGTVGGTPTASAITAPDGSGVFTTFTGSPGTNIHELYNAVGVAISNNTAYTVSAFVKAGTNQYVNLGVQLTAQYGAAAVFNLTGTGSLTPFAQNAGTNISIISAGGECVGSGLYRIWLTASTSTGAANAYLIIGHASASGNSFNAVGEVTNAAGSLTLHAWGAQIETGSVSSYIPNLATGTTTRNADTSLAFSAITLPTGLSFSRTSNAMQYDAAGRLTYAPNNLLTQSNTYTNAAWTKVRSSVSGNTLTATSADGSIRSANVTSEVGVSYIYAVELSVPSGTLNGVWVAINDSSLSTLAYVAVNLTTTPTVFYVKASATGTGINAQVGGASSIPNGQSVILGPSYLSAVTYETVPRPCDQVITTTTAYYGPRYDYDPLTRLPKGLLVEEARTNVAPNSETFPNSGSPNWKWNAVTVASASAAPPSGASTVSKLVEDTANAFHYINLYPSTVSGTSYTYSVYVKAAERYKVSVFTYVFTGAAAEVNFNLATGTVMSATPNGTNGVTATSVTNVGNGWYRIAISGTSNTTGSGRDAGITLIKDDQTTATSYLGNNTSGIYIWGAQLEAGSFPTSYIPNPGIASGARTADLPDSTNATVIGCKTFLVETNGMQAATTATVLGLNTGIGLGETTGNALTTAFGGTQTTSATATWTGIVRSGIAWGASKVSITFNGNAVTTAGNSTSALTTISLGHTNNAGTRGAFMNGWIRKAAGYPSALSDASLVTKSVVGTTF